MTGMTTKIIPVTMAMDFEFALILSQYVFRSIPTTKHGYIMSMFVVKYGIWLICGIWVKNSVPKNAIILNLPNEYAVLAKRKQKNAVFRNQNAYSNSKFNL